MSAFNYKELLKHVDHEIICVTYGENKENVSVECLDCNEVLLDYDKGSTESERESIDTPLGKLSYEFRFGDYPGIKILLDGVLIASVEYTPEPNSSIRTLLYQKDNNDGDFNSVFYHLKSPDHVLLK